MNKSVLLISGVATHPATNGASARILGMCLALKTAGWEVDFLYQDFLDGDLNEMREFWGKNFHYVPYRNSNPVQRLKRIGRLLRRNWPKHSWLARMANLKNRLSPKARRKPMDVDDWYDTGLDRVIKSKLGQRKFTAVLVEYFFMSGAFRSISPGIRRVIDTHDLFRWANPTICVAAMVGYGRRRRRNWPDCGVLIA